jgi:hypothetical protein
MNRREPSEEIELLREALRQSRKHRKDLRRELGEALGIIAELRRKIKENNK